MSKNSGATRTDFDPAVHDDTYFNADVPDMNTAFNGTSISVYEGLLKGRGSPKPREVGDSGDGAESAYLRVYSGSMKSRVRRDFD